MLGQPVDQRAERDMLLGQPAEAGLAPPRLRGDGGHSLPTGAATCRRQALLQGVSGRYGRLQPLRPRLWDKT